MVSRTWARTCYDQFTYTKFEVSSSIYYEDMKSDIKFVNWVWFGVIRVTRGHWK